MRITRELAGTRNVLSAAFKGETGHPPRWRLLGAGAALLLLLSEINGGLLNLPFLSAVSHHIQFVLLVAGIALVVMGLTASPAHAPARYDIGWLARLDFPVILITLFALAVRFWMLGDAVRLLVDESHFTGGVASFWNADKPVQLLTPMTNISPFTWLYPYGQSWLVAIFGRNLLGIRALSALVGALTCPALYLLAKQLFDRPTGLAAALILAAFPPHIHFSRIALLSIADPLVGTMAFALIARGFNQQRRLDYALGGVFLGLTQYFYEGGRLLYMPLALLWGVACHLQSPTPERRRGMLIAALAALIVTIPVYYTLFTMDAPLTGRMEASGLNSDYWATLLLSTASDPALRQHALNHIAAPFLFYLRLPDQTVYYGGTTALLLPPLTPFFLIGIGVVLWRWRSPAILILLWITITSLGNSLLIISAASTRFVVVFPALALLVAVGLRYTIKFIFQRLPVWMAQKANLFAIAIAAIFAIVQISYYFGPHLDGYVPAFLNNRPFDDLDDAVLRALEFPPDTKIHLISAAEIIDLGYGQNLMAFFADNRLVNTERANAFNEDYLVRQSRLIDQAYFVERDDPASAQVILDYYGDIQPQYTSDPRIPFDKQFVLYYVPKQ
jgi:4-amino-4-deoxy-L-arabinose transferase-like glycosyltransferase